SNFAPPVIKSMVTESLEHVVLAKESSQPHSTYEAAASLTYFDREDKDNDEDPSTGSERGLKKRKTSKDVEPTKEEPEFEVANSDMPRDQEENLGNNDEEPIRKVASKWPAFKLLKGTRTNFVELEYDFEECYKALSEKIDLDNTEGVTRVVVMRKHGYGYLREIEVRRADNELYTFKEGNFPRLRINDIEDMLLLKHSFSKESQRSSLGVKSYQKMINVTKPETTRLGIRKRDPYTPHTDPQGFIYVDNQRRNRLMRSDELYKFSDGTLTRLRTLLEYIIKNIQMEYLP
ncbi:hypothetical protein Tco_1395482, partial [Tanacetum coccineum]